MSSEIASNVMPQTDPSESDTSLFLPTRSYSHRALSFASLSSLSSSSSLSSFRDESPVFSPKSPFQSTRIPFSWEKLPGIPIKLSEEVYSSSNTLPLPPAGNQFSYRKLNPGEFLIKKYDDKSFRKDPFFAALVVCSKDHDHKQHDTIVGKFTKISRSLSESFALASSSTSCKSKCVVLDSMVQLPRSRKNSIVLGHTKRSSKRISNTNDVFYRTAEF